MRSLECVGVADRHDATADGRGVVGLRSAAGLHIGAVTLGVGKTDRNLGFFSELEGRSNAEQPIITPGLGLRDRAFDEIIGEVGSVGASETELRAEILER